MGGGNKKRQGNRAVKSTLNASGFGYLRVGGGNAFLSVGPKNSIGTDGKRKSEEASTSFQAHSPTARDHENGPKHVGLDTEGDLQAELRNRSDSEGVHILVRTKSDTVQDDPSREPRGEDDVEDRADCNLLQEQQAHYQAGASASTHGGVQHHGST
ncbi:hypothetical protein SO802_022998 [Lithocarpus litseifolius]|uniref:Uncharacterized protein n=1 Tax=Lithocarpus litseifolius TaxID=425828 RepID=A0AAW2C8F6_9ROSI